MSSKFQNPMAERLYGESLENFQDDSLGDSVSSGFGWHALFSSERAIITEATDGFVTVQVYPTYGDLMIAWKALEDAWEALDEPEFYDYDEYYDDEDFYEEPVFIFDDEYDIF